MATTSTDGNDTFVGTHTTMTALDTLDGGAGTDTLLYIDDSAAGTPLAVQFSNIETVAVRNLSGDAATTGSTEKATVEFASIAANQTVVIAGLTFTAGAAGATAAQVATAFEGGVAIGSNAGGAVGAVLSGTISGYAAADGGAVNKVLFTSTSANTNVTDLNVDGSAERGQNDVKQIVFATNPGDADNTLALTINGTAVTSVAAGGTNAAALATMLTDVAAKINAVVGSPVAVFDGEGTIAINSSQSIGISGFTAAGTTNTTTAAVSFAPVKQTIVLDTTNPGGTTAGTVHVNGVEVATATLAGNTVDDAGAALAAAINAHAGRTVATYTAGTNSLVVDNGDFGGLVISDISVGALKLASTAVNTSSQGLVAASPATVAIVDGVAAVDGSTNAMTVDASAFEGVTTIMNTASTDAVTFSGMTEIATLAVEKVTAGALATTTANFDADLTNGTADVVNVSLSGNTSAGTITIGAGFETVNVSAAGKNTVAELDTGAKTVTITGAGSLKITAAIADATKIDGSAATGKLTLTSEVNKVAISTGSAADKVTVDIADTDGREFSVATDAGNDTVVLDNFTTEAKLANDKVTIDGGAGTDTLEMKSALATELGDLTAANYAKKGIVNFEKLTISDAVVASSDTNVERLGLNSDITLKAGVTTSATLSNVAKGGTVTFAAANTGVLTVSVKDAAVAGNTADVLNLVLAAEQTADTGYDIVAAAGVETININSTTGNDALTSFTNTLQVVATSAETINISGDMKFTLAVDTNVATNFVALDTINASGNTAGVTITLDSTANYSKAVTITGTAKADTITGGDGADVINAGAGNDTVNSSAGADAITLGAGSDTFVIGTAAHSSATSTAKVTDFVGGVDAIKFVAAASFEIVSGATITNAADLAAATTAAFALAATVNNAGIEALQFTYDSKTFFAIEASSTADATAAVVIDVTGLTGTVLASDFIA